MKKISVLSLVCLLAINSYSQISRVSRKDYLESAQMQIVSRTQGDESLQNIQGDPNMLRTDYLDYTTYDWQTNAAARTWTHVWNDGKVSFAFTHATNTNFTDRGTAIGMYNSNTSQWIQSNGRVENEKTGFGSIAQYGTNGLVIAAHTATHCGIYVASNKDNINPYSLSAVSYLNNTNEPTWPAVMTSGANRNIIHVVALGYNDNQLYYFRSQNGGNTWDRQNVVLPYTNSSYCSHWSANSYYWMETTENNCLALVVNNAWSDGMVIYSYDNGETWQRKVFWHHPGINTTFNSWFMYPRWTSCQWDNNHHLHVLYEFNGTTGEPGSGSYYPSLGGVAYWNETMPYASNEIHAEYGYDPTNPIPPSPGQPFIMDSAYMYWDIYAAWPRWADQTWDNPAYFGYLSPLDENGNWQSWEEAESFNIEDFSLHGSYNSGCVAFPVLCKVPGTNGLIAVWSALDEHNMDANGNYYYKLFASYSANNGNTWSNVVHLTNYYIYEHSECVYPQAAILNNILIIAVQMDGETGTYVQSDDTDPYDNYYQGLTFDLYNLFGISPTQNYTITVSANPTNGGTVTGGGTYQQGQSCTVSAYANSDFTFTNWTENGSVVSNNVNYTFTVTGNRSLVANFQAQPQNYTISVSANPSNGGSVTGGGTYQQGQSCTVSATNNSGFTFINWMENGSVVSNNANYTFTVTSNRSLVANFQAQPQNYTISVSANPSNGGNVSGGGTYQQGQSCTVSATNNSGFTFTNWTESGSVVSNDVNYTFTVTDNRDLVAHFQQQTYTITAIADPTNGGEVSGGGTYPAGSTCVLSAMPNDGFVFENWTRNGIVVSTSPSFDFEVNRDGTYVAHFTQDANHCTITAMADPVEGGAVLGGDTYELGAICTLTAIASVGYEFINWTLNESIISTETSFSFPVTNNAVYVAHFIRIVNHYTVTASVEPTSAGSVIGAGTFDEGESCTLIAMPNPTYSFVSWTENGIVVSTDDHYTFTVDRERNLVAVFSQGQFYTISASAGANGTISPEGEVVVMPGEDKIFAMIPNSGYRVQKVVVDGMDVGPVESYTFRSVNGNHSIHVQFSGLGVDDNIGLELKIYPNPANDKIYIENPNMKRVSFFNLFGIQIGSKEVNDDYTFFNTNEFPQGTYILKVENNDGRIGYSRFVIAK